VPSAGMHESGKSLDDPLEGPGDRHAINEVSEIL
jgi:hypothetical protein